MSALAPCGALMRAIRFAFQRRWRARRAILMRDAVARLEALACPGAAPWAVSAAEVLHGELSRLAGDDGWLQP